MSLVTMWKFLFKHKIELIRGEKDFFQINGRIFLRKKRNCEAKLIDDNLVWTFTARVHFRGVEPSFTIKVPLIYRVRVQYRKLRTDFLPAQIYFSRVINPSRKNETKGHTEKMLWNKLFNLVGRTANYSRKLTNHSHVLTERYDKLT